MKTILTIDASGQIDWPETARRVLEFILQALAMAWLVVGVAVSIVAAVILVRVLFLIMRQVSTTIGGL